MPDRTVKIMVALTPDEDDRLARFINDQQFPVAHLGKAGMFRVAAMAYIDGWLRHTADAGKIRDVGSSDT